MIPELTIRTTGSTMGGYSSPTSTTGVANSHSEITTLESEKGSTPFLPVPRGGSLIPSTCTRQGAPRKNQENKSPEIFTPLGHILVQSYHSYDSYVVTTTSPSGDWRPIIESNQHQFNIYRTYDAHHHFSTACYEYYKRYKPRDLA
jgi:hypothetical protein